eukprot:COSAG02_NODE_27013_length_619_cov_0.576923_2_plen_49_part_01
MQELTELYKVHVPVQLCYSTVVHCVLLVYLRYRILLHSIMNCTGIRLYR